MYFAYAAGTSAFAATYLLAKGLNATQVGTLLATSNLLACLAQPVIGDVVDRIKGFVIPKIMTGIFAGIVICMMIIQFLCPSVGMVGLLYGIILFLSSITNSLNNSVCAYYTNHGCAINYGVGQGVGSFSFSVASLGFGYLMAWLGVDAMLWTVFGLAILMIITVLGYPKIDIVEDTLSDERKEQKDDRVSLLVFFGKYKMFMFTMIGVMFVSMCHYMSENYFIAIFERIGGGSEDVGIGMFVACLSAVPFFLCFEKLRLKIDIYFFMKLGGVCFVIKTILLIMATQVWHIYLIQLMQTVTYAALYQPLYYMARRRISEADLVKGQAVALSMYTLGGACGSFVGGRMLDAYGVIAMLWLALGAAFTGTFIIFVTLKKNNKE
jgi:PPP family 3-phenylpropionic acid transporter